MVGACLYAVIARLLFWGVTGRVWEDALISLTPAANFWDGYGFTHHPSEPAVHSFTSAFGELVLLAGQSIGQGLNAMRLASVIGAVISIAAAFRLGVALRFHWSAHCLFLGYLASDHLQVFFGMSGMETQLATMLVLLNVLAYVQGRWLLLGVVGGMAVICRPEFLLWGLLVGVTVPLFHRRHTLKVALPALGISGAWFGFAWIYFGSPVPHTITVKSATTSGGVDIGRTINYAADSLEHFSPFYQYWTVAAAPISESVATGIAGVVLLLSLYGITVALRRSARWALPAALLLGFIAYRSLATVNPYFMWYLPPFVALIFLFAACGVSSMATRFPRPAIAGSLLLLASYAAPLFFAVPLDARVQREIELDVRTEVGRRLAVLMDEDDSVVLEPLGFIGWEIRPRTTFDFPGLSSPKAFEAYIKHRHMTGLIIELDPEFVVQRPSERREFEDRNADLAARYKLVERVSATDLAEISNWGLLYYAIDREFGIYRRIDPANASIERPNVPTSTRPTSEQ